MTLYYAAVKYAVDDTDAAKVKALREGLETIAMALIEEFGQSIDDVLEALENAHSAAEWSAESVAGMPETDGAA